MAFLGALITYGVKFVMFGAVAFGAILLGGTLRKRKNKSVADENE